MTHSTTRQLPHDRPIHPRHQVRSNIRLVLSIAKKYRSEFVDYSDLIQVRRCFFCVLC